VCLTICSFPIFLQVCDDDLTSGMIPIKRKEGLFSFVAIIQDQGMERVVFQDGGRFIHLVNVGVTHILKFGCAQSLFGDSVTKEVLVHRGHRIPV